MDRYDAIEQRRIREHPEKWPALREDGTRVCHICSKKVEAAPEGSDLPTVAHFDQSWKRWCPAGPQPTAKDKAKRKRQRTITSVVRGGSPGLKG